MSKKLSVEAQKIHIAAVKSFWKGSFFPEAKCAAGVLRAAAEQINPKKYIPDIDYVHENYVDGFKDAMAIMLELADELDPS